MYVRETWCNANKGGVEPDYYYYADTSICEDYDRTEWKWKPSIHMPKEAARIWLKVTDVRVERLQDQDSEDIFAEGIHFDYCPDGYTWKQNTDMHNCYIDEKGAMEALWNSTIKKDDFESYGWDANPWVWVI